MNEIANYNNYMMAADVAAIALCILNWIFFSTTYAKKQQNLYLFHLANGMVFVASILSLTFYEILKRGYHFPAIGLYYFHAFIYIFLAFTYLCYFHYVANIIGMEKKRKRKFCLLVGVPCLIFCFFELLAPVTNLGCSVAKDLKIVSVDVLDPFKVLYIYNTVCMAVLLYRNRYKFVTKMLTCMVLTTALSYILILAQTFFEQTSFTCLTFIFPIEAVLFLFHYSSFDIVTGTLDAHAFDGYVTDLDGKKFTMVFLTLENFDMSMVPAELSEYFYHFNEQYFIGCNTFRTKSNQLVLIYGNEKNPKGREKLEKMLQDFRTLYEKFHIDYKVVIIYSDTRIKDGKTYVQIAEFLRARMGKNSIIYCTEDYLNKYFYNAGIVESLVDISNEADLLDSRVKVFCQPVLDTRTKKYRTAEVLMRLDLGEDGLVFPDVFIPLAERYGLIHTLSLIILNKSCKFIHELLEQNYEIERISVNFSIAEMKKPGFCDDIINIIKQNDIPYEKIAVELTESTNDTDYVHMKNVINKLKSYGIKIYLDDFGIGYSNTSRLLEVPFDVIKFDRSLTSASSKSENSKYMVQQFADIFKKTKYQVLFEGIESTEDEQRCIEMQADMLQGYAYSKPIPIEELKKFLVKE